MYKSIVLTLSAFILFSCGQNEVDLSQISIRNELAYQVNKNVPFTGRAFSKLKNGQTLISGSFKGGKKDGTWTEYFENGQLKLIENYKEGKYNGISELYDTNGTLLKRGNYSDGKLSGKYSENYESGNSKIIATYKNNNITGKYSSFYHNGNKQLEYYIENEVYDGDYIEYNDDGSPHKQYLYSNGKKINKGIWKKYWKGNNNTKESNNDFSIVSFDDSGKPNTPVKFFYTNGNLKSEGNYSSIEPDIREGNFNWYYQNGDLKKVINFINNKRDGLAISYYQNANYGGKNNILQKVNYKNGNLEGKFEYWSGPHQNDLPLLVSYNVAQNMGRGQWWKLEGICKNGKFDGTFRLWWRYHTNKRKEPYNMPAYMKHTWINGNLTWNGFDSRKGENSYFDKNGNKLTFDGRKKLFNNISRG